jgi:hypothetical protein
MNNEAMNDVRAGDVRGRRGLCISQFEMFFVDEGKTWWGAGMLDGKRSFRRCSETTSYF